MANVPGTPASDSLQGTAGADTLQGFQGDDRLQALDGDDVLSGGAGRDILEGGGGDDVLDLGDGATGTDTLLGGAGDDRIGAAGEDRVNAGAGADTVHAGGNAILTLGDGADSVVVATAPDSPDFAQVLTITDFSAEDTLVLPDTPIVQGVVQSGDDGVNTFLQLDLNRDGVFGAGETEIRLSSLRGVEIAVTNLSVDGDATITVGDGAAAPGQGGNGFLSLSVAQQLSAIYVGYFGRAPGPGGLDFWDGQYQEGLADGEAAGTIVDDIAESFRLSAEAQDLFPFLAPEATSAATRDAVEGFVADVFQNLFDRQPSAAGLTFWTDQIEGRLEDGINIGDIIVDIISGAQDGVAVDIAGDGQSRLAFDATTIRNKIMVANAYADAFAAAGVVWNQDSDTASARAVVDGTSDDRPVTGSALDAALAEQIPDIVGAAAQTGPLAVEGL